MMREFVSRESKQTDKQTENNPEWIADLWPHTVKRNQIHIDLG